MTRLTDPRALFLLLLAIQVEQLVPWRQGTVLVEARMEAQFEKCCGLGTSWAMEGLGCEKFSGPVTGVPTVEQGLCLEAVDICCVRAYHERQCEKGKSDARAGLACVTGTKTRRTGPGDYHRDCCEGCKLGILTGSMGQGCAFKKFTFGIPWDPAFLECCHEASPSTTPTSDSTNTASSSESTEISSPSSSLTPSTSDQTTSDSDSTSNSPSIPTPPLDDICQLMKGLLCSDICVPTPGSYYCKCREGFVLEEDGKTCAQDLPSDRCKQTNPCEQRCTDNGVAITCSCNPGYALADDKRSCIPKSSEKKTTVTNEESDFSALCPVGYRYNATNQVCDDVNECTEKGLCPGRCENTIGSYLCTSKDLLKNLPYEDCPPGYEWEPTTMLCTDIDECLILPEPCPGIKSFCVNTQGSFSCPEMKGIKSCPAGFKFDKFSQQCKDVDECAEGIHSCVEGTEVCRNIEGAYECDVKCEKGFIYNINLGTCIDVDECIESSHPCVEPNTTCKNTIGGYECVDSANYSLPQTSLDQKTESSLCLAGYKPSIDPKESCIDVDECKEHLASCEEDERCVNEVGSYRCELLKEESVNMYEKDEEGRDFSYSRGYKPQSAVSPNSVVPVANQTVICQTGFIFDQQSLACIDIDECVNGLSNCGIAERCVNVEGGHRCSPVCPPGFQLHNSTDYLSNVDESCEDINECALGLHSCNLLTNYCINTNGSYFCEAFTTTAIIKPLNEARNNKIQSVSRFPILESCKRGYTRDLRSRECVDVDECVAGPGCRDHEQCHNVPGGYECSPLCTAGWYFSPTMKGCQDVDECLLGRHDCPQSTHRCVNTNGSFACELILPCSDGFKRSLNGSCVDVDECSENLHTCRLQLHQYCVNKNGSFECLTRLPSCQSGYEYSLATRRCEDIDECTTGQYKCDARFSEKCINLPGTYRCERPTPVRQRQRQRPACPSGYRYHPRLRRCAGKVSEIPAFAVPKKS